MMECKISFGYMEILSNIEFYYFQEKRETINFLNENCFKNFICLKVVSLKQNVDFTFLRK